MLQDVAGHRAGRGLSLIEDDDKPGEGPRRAFVNHHSVVA